MKSKKEDRKRRKDWRKKEYWRKIFSFKVVWLLLIVLVLISAVVFRSSGNELTGAVISAMPFSDLVEEIIVTEPVIIEEPIAAAEEKPAVIPEKAEVTAEPPILVEEAAASGLGIMAVPTQGTPILNTTAPANNNTLQNLTAYNVSTADIDNDNVKNIYNWFVNGKSLTVLNMPFEGINGTSSNNAWDYSGYGNSGSEVGSIVWNATGGYDERGAYEFFKSGDYISRPHNESLNLSQHYTVSLWFNMRNYTPSWGNILSKGSFNNFNYAIISQQDFIWLWMHNTSNSRHYSSYFTVSENRWYHLVSSFNGSTMSFYGNGALISQTTFVGMPAADNGPLYIGGGWNMDPNGTVDDVLIFNRSLSVEEVWNLYTNKTSQIDDNETLKGEVWSVEVTPNDGTADGAPLFSNTVNILNTAPELSLTDKSTDAGETFIYDINCTDADSDAITYYDNTTLFDINETNGTITDTPIYDEIGSYTVNITCNDEEINASEIFTYTIDDPNDPVFTNAVNQSPNFQRYENFTVNITINDMALDYYIFATNASGSWANESVDISGETYLANESANITLAKNGHICWYFWANDTDGNSSASSTYCFTIQDSPPTFNQSLATKTAYFGQEFVYDINCSDIDGDAITYHDDSSLFVIDSDTGLISSTLNSSDNYAYYINISCNDGEINGSQAFTLNLKAVNPAPDILNTSFYQSPVRGEADDLLTIPGYGFEDGAIAVYRLINDSPGELSPPTSVPASNTSLEGQLRVISYANIPDSIVVLLPTVMISKQPYAIWVQNTDSNWSSAVLINNARPLWITPNKAYSTQKYAALPRELKVVGRNLENNQTDSPTKVRLVGPATYELTTINDNLTTTTIEHYVARVELPSTMEVGNYYVQVSRDNTIWLNVSQQLEVLADPAAKTRYSVSGYGCSPDDHLDDTSCIVSAINDANASGGGEIYFSTGTWNLSNVSKAGGTYFYYHGIVVPPGIDLVGAGKQSKILQTLYWNTTGFHNALAVFTLLGNNTVKNLSLVSEGFNEPETNYLNFLSLGKVLGYNNSNDPLIVENVFIYGCNFSNMMFGISIGHFPAQNIVITNNEFQAYKDALFFNNAGQDYQFYIDDSVITNNTFYPGDYVDYAAHQGTIASEIGATRRMDFSKNTADGYVNGGWRAAFFFDMANNNEMLLISQNNASCTGDKTGDGEGIVFDANMDELGFVGAKQVVAATSASVSVFTSWLKNTTNFYDEHWVFIADGKGLGQARKIVNYSNNGNGSLSQINITPAWDVVPDSSSKIVVGRNYWSTNIVDNVIDIRGCLRTNTNAPPESGFLSWWGSTTDSTMEGNKQYESNGILLSGSFANDSVMLHYANEIRNNLVDRGYNSSTYGGIGIWYGSDANIVSPVLRYNLAISHNTVINAYDYGYGGGICLRVGWTLSPTPYELKEILLFHNLIRDNPTYGIYIVQSYSWNTVLYKNVFENITSYEIYDKGTNTTIYSVPITFVSAKNVSANFRQYENFTANITIDDDSLDYYIFATNASGLWANETINIFASQYDAYESSNISLAKNNHICWYFWTNNTDRNTSLSSNYCFSVQNSPPEFNQSLLNKSVYPEQELIYDINCSDSDGDTITYYDNTTLFNINETNGTITDVPAQSEAGVYNINITCGDGEANSSQMFVYTITALTVPSTNGGGGGTSPTISPTKEEVKITAAAGESKTLSFTKDVGITNIEITAAKALASVSITAESIAAADSEAVNAGKPSETVGVYKYLKITADTSNENIEKAEIKFKIPLSWFSSNYYDKEKVTLYHYGSSWKALTTAKATEDNSYAYYEAETTGFSLFAIAAERITEEKAEPLPTSPAEEEISEPEIPEEPSISKETAEISLRDRIALARRAFYQEVKEKASLKIIWAAVLTILLIALLEFYFHYRKRRQSEELRAAELLEIKLSSMLKKGYSEEGIINAILQTTNFTLKEIETAFAGADACRKIAEYYGLDNKKIRELKAFVKSQAKRGVSFEEIIADLVGEGWKKELIIPVVKAYYYYSAGKK